jgi:hypothetical protein
VRISFILIARPVPYDLIARGPRLDLNLQTTPEAMVVILRVHYFSSGFDSGSFPVKLWCLC